ncbi:MAG: hypothetical protein WD981_07095 [Gaiellaceae bacterium]
MLEPVRFRRPRSRRRETPSPTHDPSPDFRHELEAVLRYLGVEDAELD